MIAETLHEAAGQDHVDELFGFRTIDGAVFVDQGDEVADPLAEVRAFMQVDPALVRRHLLDDVGT